MTALQRFDLKGRVILLTGGAGLYGRGLASDLAETGARLIIAARSLEKLQAVEAEARDRGLDVTAMELDQGSEASVIALRDRITTEYGWP